MTDAKITNTIERRVYADKKNAAGAKKLLDELIPIMETFKGKKFFKVDGSRTAAAAAATADIFKKHNDGSGCRAWFDLSHKSLYIKISNFVSFGSYLNRDGSYSHNDGGYYDLYIYIGEVENGVLIDVFNDQEQLNKTLKVNYKNIVKQREKIQKKLDEISSLNDTMPYYARLTN